MELRQLGRTGLRVSKLALGTMSWGRDTDEAEAHEQFTAYRDAGGFVLDTAASYSAGESEKLLGKFLASPAQRDDVIVVTKAGTLRRGEHSLIDASRSNLLGTLDASLSRLNTDYVDLFLLHHPDPQTPAEEIIATLEIAIHSGRARYVGISNHSAWQTAHLATLAKQAGIELAGAQVEYSLVQRQAEHELTSACLQLGVGIMAWSPLGRGVLTGKYRNTIPADSRAASAHLAGFVQPYLNSHTASIVEAVLTAASGLQLSALEVSLAWVLSKPAVSCAVVGARTAAQLKDSLAAVQIDLPEPLQVALDDVSATSR